MTLLVPCGSRRTDDTWRVLRRLAAGAAAWLAVVVLGIPSALGAVTFTRHDYASGGRSPAVVVAGDLNGDGRPDLTIANTNLFASSFGTLLGNGDGTFRAAVPNLVGSSQGSLTLADLDRDGRLDVVGYVHACCTDLVVVGLGAGDGTFRPAGTYHTGDITTPASVAVGDLNGDGRPDVATADLNFEGISVLLGNGDGIFQAPRLQRTGSRSFAIAAGDLNRDGRLDLVTSDYHFRAFSGSVRDGVTVLLGKGDATFQAARFYATVPSASPGVPSPNTVVIADLNGDDWPDIVNADSMANDVAVLLATGDGAFRPATRYRTGDATTPLAIAVGDLNGDGHPDLITANSHPAANDVSVLAGNGDGSFRRARTYPTGLRPFGVTVGDLDGDGRLDVASANRDSDDISVLLNATR